MDYKYIKITNKIKEEIKYPKGANTPTYITTYECLCGCGVIVERDVRGFNDHFITIDCKKCLEKYHSFVDVVGYEWKIYLKNK
jgi:hypothetical protein